MAPDKLDIARGHRICRLMDLAGISNMDLAGAARVSSATVTMWRKGHEIKCKYLPTLASALKTTTDYLLTGEPDPSPDEINFIKKYRRLNLQIQPIIDALIDKLITERL